MKIIEYDPWLTEMIKYKPRKTESKNNDRKQSKGKIDVK